MNNSAFLFKGIFLGFSLAAPVGPIGLLCIHRTLTQGRLMGFVSGLGATVADMLYGCIAGFGVTMFQIFCSVNKNGCDWSAAFLFAIGFGVAALR